MIWRLRGRGAEVEPLISPGQGEGQVLPVGVHQFQRKGGFTRTVGAGDDPACRHVSRLHKNFKNIVAQGRYQTDPMRPIRPHNFDENE